jgi:hypothetical protein
VRSTSPALAALVQHARVTSPTFQRLVDTITSSDGIVYVEEGSCKRPARACFVTVIKPGAHRLLFVNVDPHRADWDLIGSIAHELRHTIEILGSAVTSNSEMYLFYGRQASTMSSGFETPAAIEAGNAVRAEVRQYHRRIGTRPGTK